MTTLNPCHVALAVNDLDQARRFYSGKLRCTVGRSAASWMDFNFFGHQLVCHEVKGHKSSGFTNFVDGEDVPVPHFGVVFHLDEWESITKELQYLGVSFFLGPTKRFEGEAGEQATVFVLDPSGNLLEFKGFRDMNQLFRKSPA